MILATAPDSSNKDGNDNTLDAEAIQAQKGVDDGEDTVNIGGLSIRKEIVS